MPTYAKDTQVSVQQSRSELERTLIRYGAGSFGYLSEPERTVIMFIAFDRRVKFELLMPNINDREFTHTPERRNRRTEQAQYAEWEKACRQRWRALNLVVKAKLEAVEAGITTFDEEFLAHIMLTDGSTVADHVVQNLNEIVRDGSGSLPKLLSIGPG